MKRSIWPTSLYRHLAAQKTNLKFLAVGVIGFVCNYLVLKICTSIGWHIFLSEVVAAIVALQITFIAHDRWTYRKTQEYKVSPMRRYRIYVMSNSFASLLVVIFFTLFSIWLTHFPALALSAIAGLLWNYMANKILIWRHH